MLTDEEDGPPRCVPCSTHAGYARPAWRPRVTSSEISTPASYSPSSSACSNRDPDLVALLDTPTAGRGRAVRTEDVGRRVELALRPAERGGWRESLAAAREVEEIAAWGASFLDSGEVESAITVFAALSAGIRVRYDQIHDEESEIGRVLDECVDQLEACLDRVAGMPRQRALESLLDVAVWDAASGGYGVGVRARDVVVDPTTEEERQHLAARAEPALTSVTSSYSRQRLGTLLVRLRGDALDQNARLAMLRRTDNHLELIDQLLQLHRVREARDALASVEEWHALVEAADLFVRHGYAGEAESVLTEIVEQRRSVGRWMALDWLTRHAKPQRIYFGRHQSAGWAEELFCEQPTVENWMKLRAASKESRRVELRHRLAAEGRHLLLVEILVAENKHREALTKFRHVKERDARALRAAAQIADSVAAKKPREAAALYGEIADSHCKRGHPEEYEIAVELILRGRDALLTAGHSVLAKRYVGDFRKRHSRRRSLTAMLDARA